MTLVEEQEMNEKFAGAKIAYLTVDQETGSFKLTLGDGRILALQSGKTQLAAILFPSESEYQRRRQAFLDKQKVEQSVGRGMRGEIERLAEEYDVNVGDMSDIPPDILKMLIGKLSEALFKAKAQADETIN